MRLPLIIVGFILLVSGSIPIILGANEVSALNSCQNSQFCIVSSGGGGSSVCNQFYCSISPFYGVETIQGVRSLADSLIEIGIVILVVGGAITVIGLRSKAST
ncbi:hypothetical protein AUG19_06680 [archaeon 13_1_20CM_2_54_9]|nr:MAG: hypothetical protein AUJ07_09520 [Crenarchaeota archaeon 13_1_40CM_3_53_5]OLE75086.1 MAG: hypothetical protein AUG19_06680 [archaeon 13_1_20CM_2_54_9]